MNMAKRPRLTDDQKQAIRKMKTEGATIKAIAEAFKVSAPTVSTVLKKAGLGKARAPKAETTLTYDQIRARYLAAQDEVKKWQKELAKALKQQERQIARDRKELGLSDADGDAVDA